MALHTAPTLDSLTVEGLKMAGYPSATAGDTNQLRAEDWVQEFFSDLRAKMQNRRLESLMVTSYGVTTAGVSRYALPSDLEKVNSVTILYGAVTGNCTACSASQATLDNAPGDQKGKLLLLTSGTAAGNASQISSVSGKVVSVTPNFSGASYDGTEGYMIVTDQYALEEMAIWDRDSTQDPYRLDRPYNYFPIGQGSADSDETGEFQLYPVPDKVYGIQLRYFLNPNLLDITNDNNLLLTLYRRWQNVIVQKVMYKILKTDRDERAGHEEALYWKLLDNLITAETYTNDLSNLTSQVVT